MTSQLITKYRPDKFSTVIGNEIAIKQLTDAVRGTTPPHAYLLTGSSGIGKTTLARIIANELNAYIEEVSVATASSVEEVRNLVKSTGFTSVMTSKNRMLILDECHNYSKKGWEPFLKLAEDPPPYLYMAFCTTEPSEVPKTLNNRCYPVSLKPLKSQEIEGLVSIISEMEGWKLTDDVFNAIVQASEGSARKALAILQTGHSLQTRSELAQVIIEVESEDSPAFGLAYFLLKGGRDWKQIAKFLTRVEDFDAAIIQMSRCFAAEMVKREEKTAQAAWAMLNAFTSITSYDAKTRLYTAIGRIVWTVS